MTHCYYIKSGQFYKHVKTYSNDEYSYIKMVSKSNKVEHQLPYIDSPYAHKIDYRSEEPILTYGYFIHDNYFCALTHSELVPFHMACRQVRLYSDKACRRPLDPANWDTSHKPRTVYECLVYVLLKLGISPMALHDELNIKKYHLNYNHKILDNTHFAALYNKLYNKFN